MLWEMGWRRSLAMHSLGKAGNVEKWKGWRRHHWICRGCLKHRRTPAARVGDSCRSGRWGKNVRCNSAAAAGGQAQPEAKQRVLLNGSVAMEGPGKTGGRWVICCKTRHAVPVSHAGFIGLAEQVGKMVQDAEAACLPAMYGVGQPCRPNRSTVPSSKEYTACTGSRMRVCECVSAIIQGVHSLQRQQHKNSST